MADRGYHVKQYMVVEHFKAGSLDAIYDRLAVNGRMLPEGLYYLNSWVNRDKHICFQLMETDRPELFDDWFEFWSELVDFEIYPIDNR
jgi:hypothetical protein